MLPRSQVEVFSQAISEAFCDGFRYAQTYRDSSLSPEAMNTIVAEGARCAANAFNQKFFSSTLDAMSNRSASKVDQFRTERLIHIRAECAPLRPSLSRTIVMHLVPAVASAEDSTKPVIDSRDLENQSENLRPLSDAHGWIDAFTVHGFRTSLIDAKFDHPVSFTEMWRDGTVETVDCLLLGPSGDIPIAEVEHHLVTRLGRQLEALRTLQVKPPLSLLLTFLGVRGSCLGSSPGDETTATRGTAIEEDELLLPEVVIADLYADPAQILLPLFDRFYNAAGLERSTEFTPDGAFAYQHPAISLDAQLH